MQTTRSLQPVLSELKKPFSLAPTVALILCFVLVFAGIALAKDNKAVLLDGFEHPEMTVGKMAVAPQIDGKFSPAEWGGASAFTGLSAIASVGHGSLVPALQQAVFYIGYDAKYLYVAMRSPHAKGAWPAALTKLPDRDSIIFDDHIEFTISTFGREDATRSGKGFYKIMVNPLGTLTDQHFFNGTPGTEELWSMGDKLAVETTDEMWTLEMAVDLQRINIPSLDGRELIIQLLRADQPKGLYYAGWIGAAWQDFHRFAGVRFEPDAPVFQLLQIGEPGKGILDAVIEVEGRTETSIPIEVTVRVFDGDRKQIFEKSQSVTTKYGERQSLRIEAKDLPITASGLKDYDRRNFLEVVATYGDKKATLYRNASPFMQYDDEFHEKFIRPWVETKKTGGDWLAEFLPMFYHKKARASVDVNFLAVKEAIKSAKSFTVQVLPAAGGSPLATGDGAITNMASEQVLLNLPQPPDGDYLARFVLRDANGKELATKDTPFQAKAFAWEKNQLGITSEVLPPLLPIVRGATKSVRIQAGTSSYQGNESSPENTLSLWGRNIEIGANGLPARIFAGMPTGNAGSVAQLLAAPIRLEATIGRKVIPEESTGQPEIILSPTGDTAKISANGIMGGLTVQTKASVDYDGWYEMAFTVAPAAGAVTVDALDLLIDFREALPELPVDVLAVQRTSDGYYGNYFGLPPDKGSAPWESTSLMKYPNDLNFDWKSFVPRTYIGNGDRGIWIFAWSANGWQLLDDQSMLQVSRLDDGAVRARVRLLAGPLSVDAPRTLKLAIQPTPVKANFSRYRSAEEEDNFVHITAGYRMYGDSVNSFTQKSKDDYELLRRFFLYGAREQVDLKERKTTGFAKSWESKYAPLTGQGARLMIYGSGRMTGSANEGFKVFAPEWTYGGSPRVERDLTGMWNDQGSVEFTGDRITVYPINWTPSYVDFYLWHHKPLMESGVNGTWWDNPSIMTVWDFNPETGKMESVWGDRMRRDLTKRLNGLAWGMARQPFFAGNMHSDLAWQQVFWMIENDWYADTSNMTAPEKWSLDQFRAMARNKSSIMITRPWLGRFGSEDLELHKLIRRSLLGMLLSHDIQPPTAYAITGISQPAGPDWLDTQLKLRGFLDITNTPRCLFSGYWKNHEAVRLAKTNDKVAASTYANADLGHAAVVFFNSGAEATDLTGAEITLSKLPGAGATGAVKRVFDLETGEDFASAGRGGTIKLPKLPPLAGRDLRIIGVEWVPIKK